LQKQAISVRAQGQVNQFKQKKPELKGQLYTGVSQSQRAASISNLEAQQSEEIRKLQLEEAKMRLELRKKQLALSDMIENGIKNTLNSAM
jgi:hypothetical protein